MRLNNFHRSGGTPVAVTLLGVDSSGNPVDLAVNDDGTLGTNTNPPAFSPSNRATVAVSNTVGAAKVGANTDRAVLILKNQGDNDLWFANVNTVAVGSAASGNGGMLLSPGESVVISGYTGAIYALCNTGLTSVLFYWEGV